MLAPRSTDELAAWLLTHAAVTPARASMLPGHAAAMDYLAWSFFEGLGGFNPAELSPAAASGPSDCVVWANRGGGKTYLGAVATMLDLVFKPGIEIRILGGSMEQSRRMYAHLRRLFERPSLADQVRGKLTEKGVKLRNGSELELLAQSQMAVRGTRVQKLRCDEVELFDPDLWEAAQLVTKERQVQVPGVGPIRVRGAVECFSTMHLPHGLMSRLVRDAGWKEASDQEPGRAPSRRLFKWGVLDVLERCGPNRACSKPRADDPGAPPIECPLLAECQGRAKAAAWAGAHITIDDAIRMKSRVSQTTWDAEMLCLRPRRSDSVYPEFEVRRHVVRSLPWEAGEPDADEAPRWIAGMDFGFRAPTVVLLAAVDSQGTVWIVRERSLAEVVIAEHAKAIRAGLARDGEPAAPGPGWRGKPDWVGIDPAGRQRSDQTGISDADHLASAGLEVKDVRRDRAEGLELVRARLKPAGGGTPRLFIHARCEHLIECLEKYHYPADDPTSRVPVKDDTDHATDALRYMVQNLDKPKFARAVGYLAS